VASSEYRLVADVETDLAPLPPVICHGGAINQMVLNIVVNAAHAIKDRVGSSAERGLITVRTRSEGANVVIAISDTGAGVPEHIKEHIFDLFFTTKRVGEGTGQGLAIARAVAVAHGGSLTFESTIGRGTTFFVRLPVQSVPAVLARAAA
jgi:signal transduction histidine kinase